MAQCLLLTADMFVWVDETGSDARDHIRRYGYALRGMRESSVQPTTKHGQENNAIAGMTTTGVVAPELTESTVNAVIFFDFARGCLIPNTLPFNASNPRSTVVRHGLLDSATHS